MKPASLTLIAICLAIASVAQLPQGKKILIVATNVDYLPGKPNDHTWGCYTPEITAFYLTLREHGISVNEIDIASPGGGKIPLISSLVFANKYNIPDTEQQRLLEKLNNSLPPSAVDAGDYRAVYFSGGFSCLVDYPTAYGIGNIAAAIYEAGGVIGAVCDGVSGLLPVKLTNGRHLVYGKQISLNNSRSGKNRIKNAFIEEGATISNEKITIDERVITAKGVRPKMVAKQMLALIH